MSFKDAVDLSENIKDFPGILSIVLFGSLARGEARSDSKIDLAIIYSKKDIEIVKWIRYLATDRFNLHHLTLEDLKGKHRIIGALSGEGILLYGTPLNLTMDDQELKSKMIISYNTSRMDQNHRNRLNRALFGGISTYLKGGERKRKEYP
ncbi:MAG TPA: nucleotidyltransferase domain-containing protein, partial [Methanobacterium sp.]